MDVRTNDHTLMDKQKERDVEREIHDGGIWEREKELERRRSSYLFPVSLNLSKTVCLKIEFLLVILKFCRGIKSPHHHRSSINNFTDPPWLHVLKVLELLTDSIFWLIVVICKFWTKTFEMKQCFISVQRIIPRRKQFAKS